MCPYPKAEGWKQKQYFLRAPASCQNNLLPAENIKVSSVEINVNELCLPSEITYKMGHFTLEGWKWKQYFLSTSASCQKADLQKMCDRTTMFGGSFKFWGQFLTYLMA